MRNLGLIMFALYHQGMIAQAHKKGLFLDIQISDEELWRWCETQDL